MGMFFKKLSSSQIIIFSFAAMILLGSLLLMLPFSTREAGGASFADALFTATSAVCVTGLAVQDTGSYWSGFGQAVILTMIQIGGMGLVTISVAVSAASGKRIDLKSRSTLQEAISAHYVGGIVHLTGFILKMVLIFETAGAVLMAPVFCREFGIGKGIWYSVFHSISAFCNAGFDLMGARERFSSFTYFAAQPLINTVVMALIIIGGIGFMTWEDFSSNGLKLKRFRMQSKVILITSALLILLPAAYFFCFEYSGFALPKRIWLSLFQSVTARTAGFNTADLTEMSDSGLVIMIFLMLTGGSPGSTAGGMKTTTVAVLLSTAIAVFRRREHTQFFGRRISNETVRTASTILTMYLVLFLTGAVLISGLEGLPLRLCLFETASAVGTVGLTLGITSGLGMASRTILVFLMYLGRVGGLTLIFSAISGMKGNTARLPQEKLTVG